MASRNAALKRLQDRLGYEFKQPALLRCALRHSSAARQGGPSNERLEFLGDRVLGLLLAQDLSERYPQEREGDLAPRLAMLSSGKQCAAIARQYQLDHVLVSVKGSDISDKMLGDACEALIAALYLDGGLAVAQQFVLTAWAPLLAHDVSVPINPKTRLQQLSMAQGRGLPAYRLLKRRGPAHAPQFLIEVCVEGLGTAQGMARTRKSAEMLAASKLLDGLEVGS